LCLALATAAAGQPSPPQVEMTAKLTPAEATVGDQLDLEIRVVVPAATEIELPELGPSIGPFTVVEGSWSSSGGDDGALAYRWTGRVAAYRTGEQTLPAVRVELVRRDGTRDEARSEPITVELVSVLDPGDNDAEASEIADLKPPASLPADFGMLYAAGGLLLLLLLGAAVLWWLHRRYAARLAAVPAPEDPFHRTPPHEWVYAELQKLLNRRLAEEGQVQLFFAELSRILKRYLGGRYRVELLEQTSAEVPDRLRQAGAEADAITRVVAFLDLCDRVKFAAEHVGSADCRDAIDQAYRIVDATKPRVVTPPPADPVEGAA
jgi:hypothetical protein